MPGINALIVGRLISIREVSGNLEGKIATENDTPIFFVVRRGSIKAEVLAIPIGSPVAMSGPLSTKVVSGKWQPNVRHDLTVVSVLTAGPSPFGAGSAATIEDRP